MKAYEARTPSYFATPAVQLVQVSCNPTMSGVYGMHA